MRVIFKNDWFSPDMTHFKRGPYPQDVSDEFRGRLPKSAKIVEDPEAVDTSIKPSLVNETPFQPKTLAEADDERKNSDIDLDRLKKAEEQDLAERAERAARFKEQLKAEKAPGWKKPQK